MQHINNDTFHKPVVDNMPTALVAIITTIKITSSLHHSILLFVYLQGNKKSLMQKFCNNTSARRKPFSAITSPKNWKPAKTYAFKLTYHSTDDLLYG